MKNFKDYILKKHNVSTHDIVRGFFKDLEKRNVSKINGIIVADGTKTKRLKEVNHMDVYSVDKIPAYAKNGSIYSILSMASSKMYNDLDVPTPIVCPISAFPNPSIYFKTLSQDVNGLKRYGIDVEHAINNSYLTSLNPNAHGKWSALYNKEERDLLLKIMTPECFEELTTIFLLDELRTDRDRHKGNYFLVKKKGEKRYTNVVPIDLDNSMLLSLSDNPYFYEESKKATFENFLKTPYMTRAYFPFADNVITFDERLNNIKKLIHDRKLTSSQIATLKAAMGYNLPEEILKLNRYDDYINSNVIPTYDSTSYLWEHINNSLGKEL